MAEYNDTGTVAYYKNCGRCGTWVRVGDACPHCGEISRWENILPVPAGHYYVSGYPLVSEVRVREIVREELEISKRVGTGMEPIPPPRRKA